MITEEKKQTIKFIVAVSILVLIIVFVGIIMIKYEVEGETNMPFKLSKILIIGSAEGIERQKSDSRWDFSIYQNNDVYFYIDSNTKENDLLIKNVKISNIQVIKAPKKGVVKAYMPNSAEGRLYSYDEQFLVGEKLEYKGASQSSSTNLEIGSKGGEALIRFSNTDITNYTSEKDKQITHDGTWLKKVNISEEDVKFTVCFDFTIETTKNKYKANITLELPTGSLEEGSCNLEKTDMSDVIFKRVK